MNPDDLIAAFNELAEVDAEIRIDRTRVGVAETVRLVPSWNKSAVRQFKALAADAVILFGLGGAGAPELPWLRFVLDHAPELVENREQGPGRSLGYAMERQDDGTEKRVPLIAQMLPNAASASELVVRRCRSLIEHGEFADTEVPRLVDETHHLGDQSETAGKAMGEEAFLPVAELAKHFDVDMERLRKRLERWRMKNDDGWIQDDNPKTRGAKYLYRVDAIRGILDSLRASVERPSRKNPPA